MTISTLNIKKPSALKASLWAGDRVVVANVIQLGVQNLTLQAKRVIYLAISKISSPTDDVNFDTMHVDGEWSTIIYAQDFAHAFNISEGHGYDFMKLGVAQLQGKMVELDLVMDGRDIRRMIPWVSSAKYVSGQGRIELSLNKDIASYMPPYIRDTNLVGPGYALQKIKQVGSLRTLRGWRLFDLMTTQRKSGLLKISVAQLMQVLEVSEKITLDYYDFKRHVLKPAITDIRENAKVNVAFEELKRGRRITNIIFKFSDKPRDFTPELSTYKLDHKEKNETNHGFAHDNP